MMVFDNAFIIILGESCLPKHARIFVVKLMMIAYKIIEDD